MSATRRGLMITATAALAAACSQQKTSTSTNAPPKADQKAIADAAAAGRLPPLAGDLMLGDPNARVQLVEYASPSCGACASFHQQTLPELKAQYIDTGKVHLIMREFAVHPDYDIALVQFLRCGDPAANVYYQRIDATYRSFQAFVQAAQAGAADRHVSQLATVAGVSPDQLRACFATPTSAGRLEAVRNSALALNVQSTPTLFLSGAMVTPAGAMAFAQLKPKIDALLGA